MHSVLLCIISSLLIGQLRGSHFSRNVVELQDVLNHKYAPTYFNGTWITDDAFSYMHEDSLLVFNVTTRKSYVKFSNVSTAGREFYLLSFSSDMQYALYVGNQKPVYRHSFEAQYKVINLETREVTHLFGKAYLQLVEWLPMGHNLVFVKDNNLFYVNNSFKSIEALTRDGIKKVLFNGVADWVYEEEVLASKKAFWVSKDGKMLAYIKFNETRVSDMSYMHYGNPGSQYPKVVTFKYPKPGTPNPSVALYILRFDDPITFDILPDFTFPGEVIIKDVTWTSQNDLVVTWTNRIQNHSNTFLCNLKFEDSMADCKLILDFSEENGWIDLVCPVLNSSDPERFLQILPRIQQDWRSYPQLVLFTPSGEETLTQGLISVTQILGWDQTKNVVFYQAVRAAHSSESHVYMVQILTGKSFCLSCDYEKPCSYASALFSKDFTYFTLTCRGPGVPYVSIHYTYGAFHKAVLTWEDNQDLNETLTPKHLPVKQDINVPLKDGHQALVRLHLPAQMDRSGRLKYPLLLNVYGGPGSNIISDRFNIDFHTYLVSKRNLLVVHIDARGSAYRSKEQEHAVYKNLGRYEIEDQMWIVKYLTERFQFIDKSRVGIWGWSYGGFATAMVLATDKENIFKCGVSVAPVTNFMYYDSIYTERYMGLPSLSDNEVGYNWTDVTRKVNNFANKSFLLMHGTADDNVHYQQSMMLAAALEAKDIFFYQQSYPDLAHSLSSYLHHVYHTMNHFWTDCLQLYPGTV